MHKIINRFTLWAAASLLGLSAMAQTEITRYQPGISKAGITYFLPKTQLRVVVTAQKNHRTPGEFCDYAERYLRLKNVTQTPYDEWKIEKIEVIPYGVADNTKAFTIKLKSKTSAPLVELTPDGRLTAVNAKATENDPTLPVNKVIKSNKKTVNGADFKTEEILSAGSTTKMAELTANEIYDIRENRALLTKGQADFMPKDGEQLRLMLANLDQQEEGLLQLFRGTEVQETHIFAFDINPTKDIDKLPLFSFSKYLGMVDADDPAGVPVYVSIKDLQTLPAVTASTDNKKKEEQDLRYVIPSSVKVNIFSDEKNYLSASVLMAQFGRIEHLGGDLFNKQYSTRVFLSPTTGNILNIEANAPE